MNKIKDGSITQTMTETVSGIFIDLADPKPENFKIEDIAWALSRQARYAGHTMCRIPYTVGQHTVQVSKYVEHALMRGTHLNSVFMKFIGGKIEDTIRAELTNPGEVIEGRKSNDEELTTWLQHQDMACSLGPDLVQTYAFHGLMHDFAEAYLVDLPTPVKRLPGVYEAYKAVELKMDALIYETFGLAYSETKFPLSWKFGLMVVGWADTYALLMETYHFLPSRGLNWNITLDRPSLQQIYGFRWPIPNEQVYEEVLARFEELRPKQLVE